MKNRIHLRILLTMVLVCLLTVSAFAAYFNAKLEVTEGDGTITVTVQDSGVLEKEQPKLTIPCEFAYAVVTHDGETIESTMGDGEITFTVAEGGDYVITETEAPAEDDGKEDNNGTGSTTPGTGSTTTPITVLPFSDMAKSNWAYDDILWAYANGLMGGVGDNKFNPNGTLTRAMVVTILHRMEGTPAAKTDADYTDVADGKWYTEAVDWATEKGIVKGYGDTFGANDAITRDQLVTILWRYAKAKGYDVSVGEDTNILSYEDALEISEYAIPAMQWACGAGLIKGDNGYLMPKATATRAQAAAIFHRFCSLYED